MNVEKVMFLKVKDKNIINLGHISPRALETLKHLSKTSGHDDLLKTIEEICFAVLELMQIIDTTKDPLLEPEKARHQMETLKGVLQRFKRFQ